MIKKNSVNFWIEYKFHAESHETELAMYVGGKNILAFEHGGKVLTTRWNLDEPVIWLRSFIDRMAEDPYPVDAEGQYAAEKDIHARKFDTDDEKEFDAFYDQLDEWNLRHRWHPASAGAILADVYFQQVGDQVEISWNNQDAEEGVNFLCKFGGAAVSKELFVREVASFLDAYEKQWVQRAKTERVNEIRYSI